MMSVKIRSKLALIVGAFLLLVISPAALADDFEVAETRPNPIENVGSEKSQKTYTPPVEKKGVVVSGPSVNPGHASLIQYKPNLTVASLAGQPNNSFVELSEGRRISVGSLRRLEAIQLKMRSAVPGSKMPPSLKYKPDRNNIKVEVKSASDIKNALKGADGDTVKLPSGRVATVGQIRYAQPYMEKKLGYSLTSIQQRPTLSGPVVKVTPGTKKEEWKKIFNMPDNTVLESPKGKQISVGELKSFMQQKYAKRAGNAPLSVPGQTKPVNKGKQPVGGRSK